MAACVELQEDIAPVKLLAAFEYSTIASQSLIRTSELYDMLKVQMPSLFTEVASDALTNGSQKRRDAG